MQLNKIKLIDFGLVTSYRDAQGNHIADHIKDRFRGSIVFAGKHSFEFRMNSRRDDIHTLMNTLIFLLDVKRLDFIKNCLDKSKRTRLMLVKARKLQMGPYDYCGSSVTVSRAYHILPFVKEVMKYGYKDQPDYNKLQFLLQRSLLDINIAPSNNFDWMPPRKERGNNGDAEDENQIREVGSNVIECKKLLINFRKLFDN